MIEAPSANAVRIVAIEPHYSTEYPAAHFGFGAASIGALTFAQVCVRVATQDGREAEGWGAIFYSHPWAWPGGDISHEDKDAQMRALLASAGDALIASNACGHPLDHFLHLDALLGALPGSSLGTSELAMPRLAALVSLSPLDAAIHDAYGRLHGISAYAALGPEHVGWDLARVLGPDFAGRYVTDFLRTEPVATLPIAHTVGAMDPLTVEERGANRYPALSEWIADDGVVNFKVKLKGRDLAWDIARLVNVHRVAQSVVGDDTPVRLFADLNEQGPSLAYLTALLDGLPDEVFAALVSLEQPSSRDLGTDAIDLHTISARVPVILDEGLTRLSDIDRALELGWNGIALKTCKTQSLMVLALAKATTLGMTVSVQDLTNPGIALVHSAGLAARLPEIAPLESNQRQYFPETSVLEASRFPEIFSVHEGVIRTESLAGPGLGYGDLTAIQREIFMR